MSKTGDGDPRQMPTQPAGDCLTWSLARSDGTLQVSLHGRLVDGVDLDPLLEVLQRESSSASQISLDLRGITRVNSLGVKAWMTFTSALQNIGVSTSYTRCAPAIVSQLAIQTNFIPDNTIESMMIPYYCPACGDEALQEYELRTRHDSAVGGPIPCEACGATMEIDDVVELYEAVVTQHGRREASASSEQHCLHSSKSKA